ncbi:ferritin heavy chain-like [Glossophaga mutica]
MTSPTLHIGVQTGEKESVSGTGLKDYDRRESKAIEEQIPKQIQKMERHADAAPGPPLCVHNYHPECEAAVNNHINVHFHASYVYSSVAFCFDREDVALKHFSQLFLQRSNKEKEHAEKLVGLQKQRGGRIRLRDISSPPWDEWESGLRARDCALHAAKKVNQSLLSLHQLATEKGDGHLCDFLESHHLHQQGVFTKVLGDQVIKLRKIAGRSGIRPGRVPP